MISETTRNFRGTITPSDYWKDPTVRPIADELLEHAGVVRDRVDTIRANNAGVTFALTDPQDGVAYLQHYVPWEDLA